MNIPVTSIFKKNLNSQKKIIVNIGGARSSKSYSIAQLLIMKMTSEKNKKFAIGRKTMPSLKRSTYMLFVDLLKEYGLYNTAWHNKSDHVYRYHYNNNLIMFFSFDDTEKMKSTEYNYVWMEEANEFTKEDFIVLNTRLSGPAKDNKRNQIFLSLNPSDFNGWILNWLIPKFDVDIIKSTYKDNPFLSKEYVQTLEDLKEQDTNYYKIYTLGEWGALEHLILSRIDYIDKFPALDFEALFYGLDFGFNNPSSLVKAGIKEKNVYAEEIIYKEKLTNTDLIAELKKAKIPADAEIYADAAEPNRIEEIARAGFNIFPADKDVNKGIDCLKSFKIYATRNSANMIKELQKYSWQIDRAGNVLDKPVKIDDHSIDALRYGVFSYYKKYKMTDPLKLTWI